MESKAAITASCWLALAVIASVYMWVFASKLADILFGVFLPIGLLVLVGVIVTFQLAAGSDKERNLEKFSSDLQDIKSRLDAITKEIEQIKNRTPD